MTLTKEQKAVRKGAAWLGEMKPDWFRFNFDWENFNIFEGNECIIGQMFAGQASSDVNGYVVGMRQLGMQTHPSNDAQAHGFMCVGYSREHANALRDAWKFEVDKRLAAAPAEPAEKLLTDFETALIRHLLSEHRRKTNELSLQAADVRHIGMMDDEIALIASIEGKL